MENCWMEVDKLIGSMVVSNTTIRGIDFQSSSVDTLTMDSSNVTARITGTPKKAFITNSKLQAFWPGTYAYGRSDETYCNNCQIEEFTWKGSGAGSTPQTYVQP